MAMTDDEKKRKSQVAPPTRPDVSIQGQASSQATRYLGPAAGRAIAESPGDLVKRIVTPARPELANQPTLVQAGARMADTAARIGSGVANVGQSIGAGVKSVGSMVAAPVRAVGQIGEGIARATLPRPARPAAVATAGTAAAAQPTATSAPTRPAAPNPFLTSDGNVRPITAAGSAAQTTAPTPGGLTILPPTAQPADGGAPQIAIQRPVPVDPEVEGARQRNLATNARANMTTARTFGAPDLGELSRRLQNRLGGRMTESQRRALTAEYQQQVAAITGSQAAMQGQAQATLDAGNAQQLALQRDAQQEAGANERANLEAQVRTSEGAANRQVALQRPSQPITLDDGSLAMLGVDGQLTPVTTKDGKPARPRNPENAKAAQELIDAIATDAGDLLTASLQPGQAPTSEQIAAARLQAAQLRGAQVAEDEQGNRIINVNGTWMPL